MLCYLLTKEYLLKCVFGFYIFLLLSSVNVYPQLNQAGIPYGYNNDSLIEFINIELPSKFNLESFTEGARNNFVDKFAEPVSLNISPSKNGYWKILGNGTKIWRVGITSSNASSLSIIFDRFNIYKGCKVFVYTPNMDIILGAYSFRNNKEYDILPVMPVQGDSIIIELQMIKNVSNYGYLEISQVGVGYPVSKNEKSTSDQWHGLSSPCNLDVHCIDDERIRIQRNSVCRIVYDGTDRCTGTLLNNSLEDGRPLVLTSAHCIKNASSARTAIFLFDYESPYCDGPALKGQMKSIAGSILLSRNEGLDLALLELTKPVPLDYYPVYAGWDVTENPFDTTFTIHHPMGDVKKIAINNDTVLHGSMVFFDPDSHWLVPTYEFGTTEPGSSGAAIFDSNSRIRGTFSAGNGPCVKYTYDFYAKLSLGWDFDMDYQNPFKNWLDPLNSNIERLDYLDPTNELFKNADNLSNIKNEEQKVLLIETDGKGYITGHNSSFDRKYAEKFFINGSKYVYALNLDIGILEYSLAESNIRIKIWDGKKYPQNEIYSKEVYYFEIEKNKENLIRLDSAIYVDKNFFVGYEIDYKFESDTFALYMAEPYNKRINSAYVKHQNGWQQISDGKNVFNTSLAIKPLAFDFVLPEDKTSWSPPEKVVSLYPNPASQRIQLLFKEKPEGLVTIKFYDSTGRLVNQYEIKNPEANFSIDISDLGEGFYVLNVYYSNGSESLKLIKH